MDVASQGVAVTATAEPSHASETKDRHHAASRVAFGVLEVFALVLLSYAIFKLLSYPVGFDGGMNLQVARNLAEGQGYLRSYRGDRFFPEEVETNVPFVVPAAIVFAIFGVSVPSSQITNIIYIISLCGLSSLLMFRRVSRFAGACATIAILSTPGFMNWGANGFGELPGLFWWLLGTIILASEETRPGRLCLAGLCLGLAIATKWVMMMPVAATGVVFLVMLFWTNTAPRHMAACIAKVVAGLSAVIIVTEFWRLMSLGGLHEYVSWWQYQSLEMLSQAGVARGFKDTPGILAKGQAHFALLSSFVFLPGGLAFVWLVGPIVIILFAVWRGQIELRWIAIALVVCAISYFVWWLFITPTQKAWPRRIFNGILIIQILWFLSAAYLYRYHKSLGLLVALCAAAFFSLGLVRNYLGTQTWEAFAADHDAAVRAIETLPHDAVLFGESWYSAPTLALYAGRDVEDITQWTPDRLAQIKVGYLLLDKHSISVKSFQRVLELNEHRTIFETSAARIYEVKFAAKDSVPKR